MLAVLHTVKVSIVPAGSVFVYAPPVGLGVYVMETGQLTGTGGPAAPKTSTANDEAVPADSPVVRRAVKVPAPKCPMSAM